MGYTMGEQSPMYSPFFGVMGATSAMVFSAMGAAYGTAKSGTGIAAMAVMRPEAIMKSSPWSWLVSLPSTGSWWQSSLLVSWSQQATSTHSTRDLFTLELVCPWACQVLLLVMLLESWEMPGSGGQRNSPGFSWE